MAICHGMTVKVRDRPRGAALVALLSEVTFAEAARSFGVTPMAVRGWAVRDGLDTSTLGANLRRAQSRESSTKWCHRCNTFKPNEAFRVRRDRPHGRHSQCTDCDRRRKWEYRQNNASTLKAREVLRHETARRAVGITAHTLARHRLTLAQYQAMLDAQGGVCALCHQPGRRLCIDHDHATGRVRALLCWTCNVGLGNFGDDPEALRRAATYLESHR